MMEIFGLYSLKAALLLIVFWSIYQFGLRKETFFTFNRFFLFAGMIAAFLLPLIQVHYPVEVISLASDVSSSAEAVSSPLPHIDVPMDKVGFSSFLVTLLSVVYLAGVGLLLVLRVTGVIKLMMEAYTYGSRSESNLLLVESPTVVASFSFFRFIFIPATLSEESKRVIIQHEKAHIAEYHWIDLCLINLLEILWWFNPIVWLYQKSVRENHEYLADYAVVSRYDKAEYLAILVNNWLQYSVFPMANSFSYSTQLKRIKMMEKHISHPVKKLVTLLTVPALALFFWAFAEPEYIYNDKVEAKAQNAVSGITSDERPLFIIDGLKSDIMPTNVISPEDIADLKVYHAEEAVALYGEGGKNGVVVVKTKHPETTAKILAEAKVLKKEQTPEVAGLVPIEGMITDSKGRPITGAIVAIEGSTRGTVSNAGKFNMKAAPSETVVVSFVDYDSYTFKVEAQRNPQHYSVQLKATKVK